MIMLFSNASGWILLVLMSVTISLPYLFRHYRMRKIGKGGRVLLPMNSLRTHYWLGFTIAVMALIHPWPMMRSGLVRGANHQGIYLASVAFLLILVQLVLGICLRFGGSKKARSLLLTHFWIMVAMVATTIGHVFLNNSILRNLFFSK